MQSLFNRNPMKMNADHPKAAPATLDPILEQSVVGKKLNDLSASIRDQALAKFEQISDEEDVDVEKELGLPKLPNAENSNEPDLLTLDFSEMTRMEQHFWLNELMRRGLKLAEKLNVGSMESVLFYRRNIPQTTQSNYVSFCGKRPKRRATKRIAVFVTTKTSKIIASQMQSQLLQHMLELEVVAQLGFQRPQHGLRLSLQTLQNMEGGSKIAPTYQNF